MKTTKLPLPIVVNVSGGKRLGVDYDIYIGRYNPFRNLPKSVFANPYVIGRDGTRTEVLQKYENYIRRELVRRPDLIQALRELKGKRLGCWCAPQKCHGDVLIKLLKELEELPS